MKKLFLFLLGAAFAIGAGAQTIHDDMAQERSVAAFHAIRVQSGIDLYLSEGEPAVAVSARSIEFRDRIRTAVENGVLKIWFEWNDNRSIVWGNNRSLKAYVSAKMLDELAASGGSDVFVQGTMHSTSLKLDLSGGSDFRGKLEVSGSCEIRISGGSDADVSGSAGSVSISASGGSDFNGKDFSVETCTVDASGGSDVDLSVGREIRATASGGSDVYYRGNPNVAESHKSGGSEIKKRG